jgi:hypothetical protein
MADFNCKIGDEIEGNRSDVSKGGKILLKMIDENNLSILNKNNRCEGLWTRADGRRSIEINLEENSEGKDNTA